MLVHTLLCFRSPTVALMLEGTTLQAAVAVEQTLRHSPEKKFYLMEAATDAKEVLPYATKIIRQNRGGEEGTLPILASLGGTRTLGGDTLR